MAIGGLIATLENFSQYPGTLIVPIPNLTQPDYLPTTREAMNALGWDELDVLLISGDAYVDHHSFGASLLGRWLVAHGFRTGIIAQPRWDNPDDIARLGRPRLFAGVTAGALDSLVAHYTAFRKKRGEDAYSPGGTTGLRPNRAVSVYTGLVRAAFPGLPVVAGGIEASLRRATHYDFWSDALRRSLVLDSKADAIIYGMAEKPILALANLLAELSPRQKPSEAIVAARLPGLAYATHPESVPSGAEELPSHEAILADAEFLIKTTLAFERQMLQGGPCLVQRSGGRAVLFEPPPPPLTTGEMDQLYGLPFTRRAHPSYSLPIPAVAMIAASVTSHRGCAGGCAFCSLALHQGRTIQSRSEKSILDEVARLAGDPEWKGTVSDIGGPTANMWRAECTGEREKCQRPSCLFPKRCRFFQAPQEAAGALLRKAAAVPGVEHVRVASGVRHDLALESEEYLQALVGEFTGGQLKIAPEHISEKVLRLMRKPPLRLWETFLRKFDKLSQEAGKEQFVIPYLLSGFPGCSDAEMEELAAWLKRRGWRPQQVQCFIPTPGTLATAMFYAKKDPDGRTIYVARTDAERLRQHYIIAPEEKPAPVKRDFGGGAPRRDFRRDSRDAPGRDFRGDSRNDRSKGAFAGKRPGPRREFRNDAESGGEANRGPNSRPPFRQDSGNDFRRSKPFAGKPSDGKPFERRNSSRGPADNKPFGSKPFAGKPSDGKPFERRNSSRGPAGDKPFGSKPFAGKPSDGKPFERRNSSRGPAGDKPFGSKPFAGKPSDGKPFERRNSSRGPAGDKPFGSKPFAGKPSDAKPFERRNSSRGPAGDKPFGSKPFAGKPSDRKPFERGNSSRGPAGNKPFGSKPFGGKPSGSRPSGGRPSGGKPRKGGRP